MDSTQKHQTKNAYEEPRVIKNELGYAEPRVEKPILIPKDKEKKLAKSHPVIKLW